MKSNRPIIILVVIFSCLCILAAGAGAVYFFLQDRPPAALSDSGYYLRRTKVFYYPGFGLSSPFEISDAKRDSFKILDGQYALDASRVYFEGGAIPGSDPSTFEILQSPFSRDSRNVYVNGDIFSDDAANFEIVQGNLSRDSHHIYWSAESISDDPAHLVVIGSSGAYTYLKDSKTVFIYGNPIQTADPSTFEIIIDGYSRDASHIFSFDQTIPEADAATFEVIQTPYARDASSVFWMEHVIPGADPTSFKILNVNFECTADNTHAYYEDVVIQNADPGIFPPNSTVTNCDANGIYFYP